MHDSNSEAGNDVTREVIEGAVTFEDAQEREHPLQEVARPFPGAAGAGVFHLSTGSLQHIVTVHFFHTRFFATQSGLDHLLGLFVGAGQIVERNTKLRLLCLCLLLRFWHAWVQLCGQSVSLLVLIPFFFFHFF